MLAKNEALLTENKALDEKLGEAERTKDASLADRLRRTIERNDKAIEDNRRLLLRLEESAPAFSWTTGDGFFVFIKDFAAQKGLALRSDPFDPGHRFSRQTFKGCWNREEVVQIAVEYFEGALGAVKGAVECSGLCATLASRGCGKSFIVDHLCRLHNMRNAEGQLVLGERLNSCLVSALISFNGPQSLANDPTTFTAEGLLCARLVHSAFFDTNSVDFSVVAAALPPAVWDKSNVDVVFDAVVMFFRELLGGVEPVVLLAVDEVARLRILEGGDPLAVLVLLKRLLDARTSQCRLLVTTFDNIMLLDDKAGTAPQEHTLHTGSKRRIYWLPLRPLELSNPRDDIRSVCPVEQLGDLELSCLLSFSGGHPRSLAILKDLLSGARKQSMLEILKQWVSSMATFRERVEDEVMDECLARTILGEKLNFTDIVAGSTVQRLVENSVLINALAPEMDSFVPQLSLLRLYHWTETSSSEVSYVVSKLLACGADLHHTSFERFLAVFEELCCWAWHRRGRNPTPTLTQWLPNARLVCGRDLELSVPKVFTLREPLPYQLQNSIENLLSCRLAATNQPGFDVLQPMGKTLLLHECRYSEPPELKQRSSSLLQFRDVWNKAELTAEQVRTSKALVNGKPVSEASCALVLSAFRDTCSKDLETFAQGCVASRPTGFSDVKMPVLVMDRSALLKHFGQTFQALAGFQLSYKHRHH